jgi:hypothetical protein
MALFTIIALPRAPAPPRSLGARTLCPWHDTARSPLTPLRAPLPRALRPVACAPPGAMRAPRTRQPVPLIHRVPRHPATQRRDTRPSHAHLPCPRLLRFFSRGVQWRWWCGVPCRADGCRLLPRPWQGAHRETRPHPGAPGAFTGRCGAPRCPPCGPSLRRGSNRDPGRPSS